MSIDVFEEICNTTAMELTETLSDRQHAILSAAFHVFATYGYRRATMDDVAKAADLSRTALYVHYRNKEDIFRSLAIRYFAEALEDMRAALNVPGKTPAEAMMAAFVAKDGKFMNVVLGTPHGRELLDAGFSISAEIAEKGEEAMKGVLVQWLSNYSLAEGMGTANEFAETLWAALKGLKLSSNDLATYRAGQERLAKLFGMAVS